jgi:hypothetical protein
MDIEALAEKMRRRAMKIEDEEVRKITNEMLMRKAEENKRLDELRSLYFNAGRWAGGSRDRVARRAFEELQNAR